MLDSSQKIKQKLEFFFKNEKTKVCVLKGSWGAGKTFFWKNFFEEKEESNDFNITEDTYQEICGKYHNYSYVSLFGVKDLRELKNTIFNCSEPLESTASIWNGSVSLEKIFFLCLSLTLTYSLFQWSWPFFPISLILALIIFHFPSFNPLVKKSYLNLWEHKSLIFDCRFWSLKSSSKALSNVNKIGIVKKFLGDNSSFIEYQYIKDLIICFDDIERIDKGMSIATFMGYVDQLAQQKNCKIIIILNDDQLKEEQKETFDKYREKIVDVELLIDLDHKKYIDDLFFFLNDHSKELVLSLISDLEISNLRVLKKISSIIKDIFQINIPEKFYNELISESFKCAYFYYGQVSNKLFEDFEKYIENDSLLLMKATFEKEKLTDTELQLQGILSNFPFTTNNFSKLMISFLKSGFLDKAQLISIMNMNTDQVIRFEKENEIQQIIRKAWALYEYSYQDNLDELIATFRIILDKEESFEFISPNDFLSSLCAYRLLKKMQGSNYDYREDINNYLERGGGVHLEHIISRDWRYSIDKNDQDIYGYFLSKTREIFYADFDFERLMDKWSSGMRITQKEKDYVCSKDCDTYFSWIKKYPKDDFIREKIRLLREESQNLQRDEIEKALMKIANESELNRHRILKGFDLDINNDGLK